ncbi:hypothetical protein BDZ97DRAFT_1768498 [Flammula alnicola]|nr:hypothetical protein BDZ97DRAFT_1768498 [Flammula alnicola]
MIEIHKLVDALFGTNSLDADARSPSGSTLQPRLLLHSIKAEQLEAILGSDSDSKEILRSLPSPTYSWWSPDGLRRSRVVHVESIPAKFYAGLHQESRWSPDKLRRLYMESLESTGFIVEQEYQEFRWSPTGVQVVQQESRDFLLWKHQLFLATMVLEAGSITTFFGKKFPRNQLAYTCIGRQLNSALYTLRQCAKCGVFAAGLSADHAAQADVHL